MLSVQDAWELDLLATDQGPDAQRWKTLRPYLLSLKWNPDEMDPEKAFGATPGKIEGMKLAGDGIGGLKYVEGGASGAVLSLLAMPKAVDHTSFASFCKKGIRSVIKSTADQASLGEATTIHGEGLTGCEVIGVSSSGRSGYWALVAFASGGLVMASGEAEAATAGLWRARFGAAVRALKPSR
ncbi:MAG: hypothetical protein HY901_19820 [Deltaproteobacteria bacterium]|nr:hypothetical protein [Deltaproteobacteria bacterium]